MQSKMHLEMQFSSIGILYLRYHNISFLFNGLVNIEEKLNFNVIYDFILFYLKIAVRKSCTDTREKCVFLEKSRAIAMDSENSLKLTTEGMK